MIKPEKHINEKERLALLESYAILDTAPEIDFDNLTLIASQICGTPISLISFVDKDRQWFKSHSGLDISETSREYSFCAYAINDPDKVFIIEDTRKDIRFHDNPIVTGNPHVIFYAGVPLKSPDGLPLGTLCVIDHEPKILTENQIRSLQALSDQTMKLMEFRLNKIQLENALIELEKKNEELERFAYSAAHDLKSPLANISGLTEFFSENYGTVIDNEGQEIIDLIQSSSIKLKEMIENLLDYSKSELTAQENKAEVDLEVLKKELSNLFICKDNCSIVFNSNINFLLVNKTAIEQILINLVANAIKYNDKERVHIEIEIIEQESLYKICVSDNGPGILKEHHERIFEIYEVVSTIDKFGQNGSGIGLATVKKIIEALGGTIHVESELGKGAKFIFTISRL